MRIRKQRKTKKRKLRKHITRKRGGGWFDFWKPKESCTFNNTITSLSDADIKFIDDCCYKKKYYFFGDKTLKPAYDKNNKLTSCGLAYDVVKNSKGISNERLRLKDELGQKKQQGQNRIASGFIQASPDKL